MRRISMWQVIVWLGAFCFAISGPEPYRSRYEKIILAAVFIAVVMFMYKLFVL
jgi:hypothetical protein